MLDRYFEKKKTQLVMAMLIGGIVLLVMGSGEFIRCVRWMLPPSKVAMAEANAKGLGGFGHVRLEGAEAGEQVAAIVKKSGEWDGAYVPIQAPRGEAPAMAPAFRVIGWVPQARSALDIAEHIDAHGFEGFVDSTAEMLQTSHKEQIRAISGGNAESCWILVLRRPSWLKGFGLFGGGLGLGAVLVLMMARNKP